MEQPLTFTSEFLPEISIVIVLSDNPQYEVLKPFFEEYGYGFMVPNKNLIIIDGEQFIDNFDSDVLKFIEAHEISHVIMGHDGPRSEEEELDADLGAYILLKNNGNLDSIEVLLDEFSDRHGLDFEENLLERVKKWFPEY